MNFVYAVIIEDRHYEPNVELFSSASSAIERAKVIANENMQCIEDYGEHELNSSMIKIGWLLYITYSCEGDSVRVLKREVK